MKIVKQANGSRLEISLEGRLDTMTAPQLEKEIQASIGGITDFILDFEKLEYISSAGLRVVLTTQKLMSKQGTLTIRNVNEVVMEVFEVTGFSDILIIE